MAAARPNFVVCVALAALVAAGCRVPGDRGPDAAESGWQVVFESDVPFRFNAPATGPLRIDDPSDGRIVFAESAVAAGTHIVADPTTGMNVGPHKVVEGPLPAFARYRVWQQVRVPQGR